MKVGVRRESLRPCLPKRTTSTVAGDFTGSFPVLKWCPQSAMSHGYDMPYTIKPWDPVCFSSILSTLVNTFLIKGRILLSLLVLFSTLRGLEFIQLLWHNCCHGYYLITCFFSFPFTCYHSRPKLFNFLFSHGSLFCLVATMNTIRISNQLPLTALGEKPKARIQELDVLKLRFLPGRNYLTGSQITHGHGSALEPIICSVWAHSMMEETCVTLRNSWATYHPYTCYWLRSVDRIESRHTQHLKSCLRMPIHSDTIAHSS